MNMMTKFTNAADPLDFAPALGPDEWKVMEDACHSFGVNRRVTIVLAAKSRTEMAETLRKLNEEEEGFEPMLDMVIGYREHVERMADFAKMVEARLIIAAHDALGLTLDETEPQDDQPGA
jgi:sugar phosphate isomerase/epimerase